MRITVIGTGYLGAVHAAGMAQLGHDVLGVDVDAAKIDRLSHGQTPFYEPGFPELLRENIDSGRLHFSTFTAPTLKGEIWPILAAPWRLEEFGTTFAYWFLIVLFLMVWTAFLAWRWRRLRRLSSASA